MRFDQFFLKHQLTAITPRLDFTQSDLSPEKCQTSARRVACNLGFNLSDSERRKKLSKYLLSHLLKTDSGG